MVGLLPSSGVTGICREKGLNIPSSMLATIASQIGGTVGVTSTGAPTGTKSGLGGSTDKPDSSGSTKLTPSEPTTGSNGPGGISIGPIVGIVVGSLVVFALTVTLALWWHRRSLRRNPPTLPQQFKRAVAEEILPLQHDALELPQFGSTNGQEVGGGHVSSLGAPVSGLSPPQGSVSTCGPPQSATGVTAVSRAEMEAPRC